MSHSQTHKNIVRRAKLDLSNRPWTPHRAIETAQDAYETLFNDHVVIELRFFVGPIYQKKDKHSPHTKPTPIAPLSIFIGFKDWGAMMTQYGTQREKSSWHKAFLMSVDDSCRGGRPMDNNASTRFLSSSSRSNHGSSKMHIAISRSAKRFIEDLKLVAHEPFFRPHRLKEDISPMDDMIRLNERQHQEIHRAHMLFSFTPTRSLLTATEVVAMREKIVHYFETQTAGRSFIHQQESQRSIFKVDVSVLKAYLEKKDLEHSLKRVPVRGDELSNPPPRKASL